MRPALGDRLFGAAVPGHDRHGAVLPARPALPDRPAGGLLPDRDRHCPSPGPGGQDPAPYAGQSAYRAGGGEGKIYCYPPGKY